MGEIADWMIEQMLEMDPTFYPFVELPRPRKPTFIEWRERFVWTDINKVKHPLNTIDNRYLGNIIPFLQRRYDAMPGGDDKKRVGRILQYLRQEQKYREKHHIVIDPTPCMKVVKHAERSDA